MKTYLPFNIRRNLLAYKFFKLRTRALDDAFKALQTGSKLTLGIFPGIEQRVSPRLKLIGTRNNHVAEIAGTSERKANFDNRFRPLKRHSL